VVLRFVWIAIALLAAIAAPPARAADDEFLEPEKAFQFSAKPHDAKSVEVTFAIAPGYYLYREQFKFAAAGAALGTAAIPAGKVKFDETFQKNVETYRGELRVNVPVDKAPSSFVLNVVSQGCADAGLCYPPMTSSAQISLVAFGGDGTVRVQAAAADSGAMPTANAPAAASNSGVGSWFDGSGIEGVLRSGHFWLVVGAFFAMGVALSFTPCVLPMLPILSSIIAGSAAPVSRARALAAWRWSTRAWASPRASPARAWPRACNRRRCWRCSR
jgi:thiol:disulfide interchange protein DsbD